MVIQSWLSLPAITIYHPPVTTRRTKAPGNLWISSLLENVLLVRLDGPEFPKACCESGTRMAKTPQQQIFSDVKARIIYKNDSIHLWPWLLVITGYFYWIILWLYLALHFYMGFLLTGKGDPGRPDLCRSPGLWSERGGRTYDLGSSGPFRNSKNWINTRV